MTKIMNKLEIVTTEDFNEDYGCYGYEEFLRKVLHKCANKKEYGLTGKVIMTFAEPGRSFDFTNENNEEFYVRYFIQEQTDNVWRASYTLYKTLPEPKTVGRVTYGAEEISCSYAITHYINEPTEEEKSEILEQQAKDDMEAYEKEHYKICPRCGGKVTNEAPNGAGILEDCKWYCLKCGWEEE